MGQEGLGLVHACACGVMSGVVRGGGVGRKCWCICGLLRVDERTVLVVTFCAAGHMFFSKLSCAF